MPTSFDQYSHSYKDHVNQSVGFSGLTIDFFTKGKADILNELIVRYKKDAPIALLDVGCGVGAIHPFLAAEQRNLTGIDISVDSLDIAKKDNPSNVYSGYDGEKIPFGDNHFDLTYTICVMHHVPPAQWQAFILEMVRVTKPGGMIVIFEHNPFNPLTRLAVSRCPFDEDAVLLRAQKVETMLKKTKQISPKTDYIFFTPFKSNFFRQVDRFFSWLPLGGQYCTYGIKENV